MNCPARGQLGQGQGAVHRHRARRSRCHGCGQTFGARPGTIFHRRRTPAATITPISTRVRWGSPLVASDHADGLQPQTVRAWLEVGGQHAAGVHHAQVVQPRDLGQVQADAVRVSTPWGVVWMALAVMGSTRWWWGGGSSTRRDQALIRRLVTLIAACALVAPLLRVGDGFRSSGAVFRRVLRTRAHHGGRGAPRTVPWRALTIGHVVKPSAGKRGGGVRRRLVQGSSATAQRLVAQTPGCRVRNTASSARVNGTFRARLAALARRTQHLVHRKAVLQAGM